jgi:murein DD-endopeptidase MepM/ murein hydrolase activator NlpD
MGARFYVPSTGRFASADSIVPAPENPQSHNRFSYVLNNPVILIDPSGHCYRTPDGDQICPDKASDTSSGLGNQSEPEPPSNLITHLPLDTGAITGQSGFGPNWYSHDYCNQACYPQSHNIHTGLDFFADAGSTVYATVSGEIVDLYGEDGEPNVVIKVTVDGEVYYVVHGHVKMSETIEIGQVVKAGDPIGTVEDQGSNSHVHLGIRQKTDGQDRAYNPLLFMAPELTEGMSFVSEDYPYYGNESPTSIRSFLYGTGSYFDEDNRESMGIIR